VRVALRRVPAAARVCAVIALLNACVWSLLTPPFQGKDEVDHFAYVAQLAETGALPSTKPGPYSPQETLLLRGLHYYEMRFSPATPAIGSTAEQRTLTADANAGRSTTGSGYVGVASPEPPLYYALQVVPYFLGGGNMLAQLQLMRLLSALFAAITALLVFFFLRELLPGVPWAASVSALCIALQPLLGSISGSVNPEAMLYAVSAALFLCLARAFRRGLTRRLSVVLGVLIAVGFLTKLNFVGVAFGVYVGLVVLTVREARADRREALGSLAVGGGIGAAPVLLYALVNVLSHHSTFGIASGIAGALSPKLLFKEISYTWQMFLPRLPGIPHYFPGIAPYREVWFDRSVGLYGWMETTFPGWVDNVALVLAVAVAALCARELVAHRSVLRVRLPELGAYAAIVFGVLVLIGFSSYHTDVVVHELALGEPRYLLPMLPLLGAVLVLAMRGAGRRWAPVVGAAMVVLFIGHDIFSQLQVIARYYG
jgi:4-amino-4-deoxy-L-arabinose transferase-like glycosyltransferase